ncbi:hypothetical protein PR003_g14865 [Phytophthora rubi]|uniref:DUF4604 domain-containing protein n=1 Tax=Phytophthora rubi TaxID=129364 RepID=A0A6A3L3V4_9STRA|nr:hypothetical protein PR002_g14733 [Phytophthora rubi]KAE9050956.1 hypothetical protein PR001_g1907 [Phytophthora rubi]KAE9331723.1 hypothetical protein PR003_g14865 [Phytophthora rubi]
MNDDWREDGSLKGLNAGGGGGKARGKGKGPQFTRVIPKFLQKYHQPPAIQAKFATLPKLGDDEEDEGLDEVQQAAIDEYLAKKEEKKQEKEKGKEEEGEETTEKKKTKTSGQTVVQMGKATDPTKKKKRKRTDRPTLSNKKLLSFSMDDE